jgi:copper homeostasis protein
VRAAHDGAHRVELSENLAAGGVTPSLALLRAVRAAVDRPLLVLVRSRPGDFVYAEDDVATMCRAVREARLAGADAVAVGALTRAGLVDRTAIERFREAAGPLPLVAHRAVDAAADLIEAVDTLAALGVTRVLTSGGAPTAEEGIPRLRRLVEHIGERVTILAGGSVRARNVRRIVDETGVREVHLAFTADAEPDRVRGVVTALASRRA